MRQKHGIILLAMSALAVLAGVYLEKQFSMKPASEPVAATEKKSTKAKPNNQAQPIVDANALLSVYSGNHANCHDLSLNEESLMELPQQSFETHHSWSKTADKFSGPSLSTILEMACPNVATIKLRALNDYAIEMDYKTLRDYEPIISHSLNDKRLSIRDKGPLWVMIPLDKYNVPKRAMDDYLIWQLSDITIVSTDETS